MFRLLFLGPIIVSLGCQIGASDEGMPFLLFFDGPISPTSLDKALKFKKIMPLNKISQQKLCYGLEDFNTVCKTFQKTFQKGAPKMLLQSI